MIEVITRNFGMGEWSYDGNWLNFQKVLKTTGLFPCKNAHILIVYSQYDTASEPEVLNPSGFMYKYTMSS